MFIPATKNHRAPALVLDGLSAVFKEAPALPRMVRPDGEEVTQGLPPGTTIHAYNVDDYIGCPDNWRRGGPGEGAAFIPVREGTGLWIDFNVNRAHTHEVAIVISIQGVNPITGQPTDGIFLEKYSENCPVHKTQFGADRFCEGCGYKWPPQNYLASTGTPSGLFWLDGFRAEDGVIRQFVMTAEKMQGVAANIIGDDRVYAIGIAFFLSKNPKPVINHGTLTRSMKGVSPFASVGAAAAGGSQMGWADDTSMLSMSVPKKTMLSVNNVSDQVLGGSLESATYDSNMVLESMGPVEICETSLTNSEVTVLEVGSGAKIEQQIYTDPNPLEYWEEKPAVTFYVNYAAPSVVQNILKAGMKDRTKGGEGFLAGIPSSTPAVKTAG